MERTTNPPAKVFSDPAPKARPQTATVTKNNLTYFKGEIPSSLDARPIVLRFCKGDARPRPTSKFSNIKSKVDTGKKPAKMGGDVTDKTQIVTKMKGELFGRMAPDFLSRFIIEGDLHEDRSHAFLEEQEVLRNGIHPARMPPSESDMPKIILLDMRSESDFYKFRIRNAINFPSAYIQRDAMFGQLNLVRNQPNKLIVIYMDDERHGTQVAKTIFEKGFDNIYLLTGGIFVFGYENPGLLEGDSIPNRSQLQQWHSIATVKKEPRRDMQSSLAFRKSIYDPNMQSVGQQNKKK